MECLFRNCASYGFYIFLIRDAFLEVGHYFVLVESFQEKSNMLFMLLSRFAEDVKGIYIYHHEISQV